MAQTSEITLGYYVERIKSKVGTGDTSKKATMENYWLASEVIGDQVRVELLDMHDEMTGFVEWVPQEDFAKRFEYAPTFSPRKVSVRQQQADRVAARAERHLEANEYLSAEFEFSNALKLDEQNVRANFGLGKTYLATGQTDKAADIFRKLSTIEAVLEPQNKHIFNEFGMNLRKMGLYVEAVRHYHRALTLGGHDENLWFNLGRALFEGGQHKQAQGAVKKALEINPNFEEARQYLAGIMRQVK
ncbi:MAG: tetratricopeptide repeat protein [Pseudomonadota bacterium]